MLCNVIIMEYVEAMVRAIFSIFFLPWTPPPFGTSSIGRCSLYSFARY